jgi:hypothetical protein
MCRTYGSLITYCFLLNGLKSVVIILTEATLLKINALARYV